MIRSKHCIFFVLILGVLIHKYYCKVQSYTHKEPEVLRFHVATFNFEHVADVYSITLWILLGSLAKIGFHLSHRLTEKFPESCLLIILGLIVGGLLYATRLAEQKAYVLNSNTFFLFLLPPIILEAGYFMPNRPFFDNLGTILLLAIVNTLFNTICIGLTLWGFQFTPIYGGTQFGMLPCLVFAALISAVDPVAVLATFTEIHVNDMLYIVVFGESLLNDAVSVVLYRMFDSFAKIGQDNIIALDIILGILSFFVVALGGVLIGIIFGVIACFTTKFTEHAPVLEPLIILVYAYLAYLTSEMVSVSGILALTFCGMVMKQYVSYNISKKSDATTEYVLKMLSSIMETIIFMFMGLSTVSDNHSWNTGFVLMTLFLCLLYRVIGVAIFANLANCWRLLELTRIDMLIMSYGGLRGAIAFALALVLDETKIERKKEFVTATIAVVFFTVFLQGITIGPLVKLLNVRRKQVEEPTMSAKLTNRMMDHSMTCLEEISGSAGDNALRDKCRNLDRKYFKRWLLREVPIGKMDMKLLRTFKDINVRKAMQVHDDAKGIVSSTSTTGMHKSQSEPQTVPVAQRSEISPENLLKPPTPNLMKFDRHINENQHVDAHLLEFLDSNLTHARRRATIHHRSQDDIIGMDEAVKKRFEKLAHYRDRRHMPGRGDRENLQAIKSAGKAVINSGRKGKLFTNDRSETSTPNQASSPVLSPSVDDQSADVSNKEAKISSTIINDLSSPLSIHSGGGTTAAERSRPWVHSPNTDGADTISQASNVSASTNQNDPNLHRVRITAADINNEYRKPPESITEPTTVETSIEKSTSNNVSDVPAKRATDSSESNNNNNISNEPVDPRITRL